ncbi:hypothetical protein FH972_026066 [Carpinus fangiana]|uniref:Uncharacterized protein n=1 Tax=Carpinus fangiana TaxID=176857 RepID=A0A5N6L3D5_9ROSI|nr:hypothetical protein FH972_026066 [Carpinus fangiana]
MASKISLQEAATKQVELLELLRTRNNAATASAILILEDRLDAIRLDMAKQSEVISGYDKQIYGRAKSDKSLASSLRRLTLTFARKMPDPKPQTHSKDLSEQELSDIHQQRDEAVAVRNCMFHELKAVEDEKKILTADKTRQDGAKEALDALYESAFDGPTPELPGEDELEAKYKVSQQHAEQASRDASLTKQVHGCMANTVRVMTDANQTMSAVNKLRDQSQSAVSKQAKKDMWRLDAQYRMGTNEARKHMKLVEYYYAQAAHTQNDPDIIPEDPFTAPEGMQIRDESIKIAQETPDDVVKLIEGQKEIHRFMTEFFASKLLDQKRRLDEAERVETEALEGLEQVRKELLALRREYLEELSQKPRPTW